MRISIAFLALSLIIPTFAATAAPKKDETSTQRPQRLSTGRLPEDRRQQPQKAPGADRVYLPNNPGLVIRER